MRKKFIQYVLIGIAKLNQEEYVFIVFGMSFIKKIKDIRCLNLEAILKLAKLLVLLLQ